MTAASFESFNSISRPTDVTGSEPWRSQPVDPLIQRINWTSGEDASAQKNISQKSAILERFSTFGTEPCTDTLSPPQGPHQDGKEWTYLINLTATVDKDGKKDWSLLKSMMRHSVRQVRNRVYSLKLRLQMPTNEGSGNDYSSKNLVAFPKSEKSTACLIG